MVKRFSGSGGLLGGPSTPTDTDDNLFSTDIVEIVLGVSEGPINGLKDGPKSFLLGDTPLKNVNDQNNFDSFELILNKGSDLGEVIIPRMGGFGSSTTVNTELASGVPVVRQGTQTNIDYIDIRLVINRLLRQNDNGTFDHTGKVKIEYKKTSSPTWLPVSTVTNNPPIPEQITDYREVYTDLNSTGIMVGSPGDRLVYRQDDPPSIPTGGSTPLWFDSNDNFRPYWISGGTWVPVPGAAFASGRWLWNEVSPWGNTKQTASYVSTSSPVLKNQGDYWVNPSGSGVLFFNGSTWINAGASLKPGNFGQNAVSIANGEVVISGKTTTNVVREYRFPIDNTDSDTYQFRITKTSPDNNSEDFFDVVWESFQEISASPMQFPGLASVQLTARSSEQFSSIPQISGIYEGRVIRVPSNYDSVAKTYSGIWDGTFKLAYTNNPAYIVYDLVSNDRYGMNAYYPVVLNKWDVYEAGVWCDTRTVDNIPRFTFNQLIDTARSCREAVEYICGIFGGRFFDDGNGSANIRIDKPESAAGIFTPENVVDGVFSYSFTDVTSRYNDITVTFKNPALNYQEDRRRVFNQSHIDRYGRIPLNFIAVGCNSSAEAIVRGRYKLVTGLAETAIVNFKTNRQGLYYEPYNIILIVDEDMNGGLSGRIKNVLAPNRFSLRDEIYLEPGFNYKVQFQIPDGLNGTSFIVVERELPPGISGGFMELTTLTNLPDLPDNAVFSISTTDNHAAPRAFRITRIDEVDGDPDNVEIQAIEVNRLKWDFVDGEIEDYEEPEHYDLETGGRTQPVPALRIRAFDTMNGSRKVHNIILDWDPSPTKTTSAYKVYMSKDNGPQSLLGTTGIYSFEWNDIPPGEYLFTVVAVSSVNNSLSESIPVTIEHRFVGDLKDPERVTDLRLIDEANPPLYARRSPSFAWTAVTTPNHSNYVVRIYDPVSGVVLAQHYTYDNFFVYDYQTNRLDHAGVAARRFDIGVASRDQFGGVSAFNIISVDNPAPGAAIPSITSGVGNAVIKWNTTGITDYSGVKIWISTLSGFTPAPDKLVYEGGGNSFTFIGSSFETYYLRMAILDDFSDSEYNVSSQVSFTIEGVDLTEIGEELMNEVGVVVGNNSVDISARLNELSAKANELALAVMDFNSKTKEELKVLFAQHNGAVAGVVRNEKAIVAESYARAEAITQVLASVDEVIADGMLKFESEVMDGGAEANIVAKVRVGTDAGLSQAAWILRAVDDGMGGTNAYFGVLGDFHVFDSVDGEPIPVFSVMGGEAVMTAARIQLVRSGRIESNDGLSFWDLDGGNFRISGPEI